MTRFQREQRTRLPEMASTPEKIRRFQRRLYLASKQKKGYRFYSLYDKTYRMDFLREAYRRCKVLIPKLYEVGGG